MRALRRVKAFAPATVANVSCGFDILGFAIEALGDQVTVSFNDEARLRVLRIEGDGGKLPLEADKNTCAVAIHAMLLHLGSRQGMDIILEKGLPLGSGMGSSAASAAAALVAANVLLGEPFTKAQLVPFAMEAERVACGAAHADNVAPAILGGFVLIRDYHPLDLVPLPVPEGLYCTLLHPHLELRTEDARSVLKQQVSLKDATVQSGNIAGLVAGLYQNDLALVSRSLKDVIAEPSRALLIPGFYALRTAVMQEGALGSGISGSGPTIFVMSPSEEQARRVGAVAEALYQELGLGLDVYYSAINRQGAHVLETA
ncbi:homoserine kinase [Nitritalea halalkaliphila LW7]|uniref:Homoserine kinase n=1 Tax=Nitritalea halalkaliphila LW7 TaxID=1189621 RepID=I5C5N4_9BACT|nr:homoserine kinase [Nitritalea halalkaliphila LW7]